ncbi:MAG: hypothetical protein AAF430_20430 [Myxococcota bacterium]
MFGVYGFGRALVFAAVAALGLPAAVTFLGPWIGEVTSVHVYVAAFAVAFVAGLVPDPPGRRAWVWVGAAVATALALLPIGTPTFALSMAGFIALGRLLARRPHSWPRAIGLEIALGLAGLALASFLFAHTLLGYALAIWGYFLVQSAYFVCGGRRADPSDPEIDPFERAERRLARWLESEDPTLRT